MRRDSGSPGDRETVAREATMRALFEVAVAASGVRDPAEVAMLAVENANRLLGTDGAVVFTFDVASGLLKPLQETPSPSREQPIAPGEGAIGIAFHTAAPVIVEDYATWPHAMTESAARGMVSGLAVPLISEGRPLGALGVWTYSRRDFGPEDVQLASLFASHVAPALEAARLTEQADQQARTFAALHEVAVAAGGVLEPVALAKMVVDRTRRFLDMDGAGLWWWDQARGVLDEMATDDSQPGQPRDQTHKPGEGVVGLAFQKRRAVLVEDYFGWKGARTNPRRRGVASGAAVPLITGDHAAGALAIWSYDRRRFSPEVVQLLRLFAGQIAPVIELARLSSEAEAKARTFEALHEMAVATGGVLDPSDLGRMTVDRARDLLDADSAALVLDQGGNPVLRVVADNDPRPLLPPDIGRGQGAIGRALRTRHPVNVGEYASWGSAHQPAVERGIKSVLAVPLLVGDRSIGGLVVRSSRPNHFDAERVTVVTLLAAQVAPAIEAARLAEERQGQARDFRILHQLAVSASGVLETGVLARQAVEHARELVGADGASVAWWDPATRTLRDLADTDGTWSEGQALAVGRGVIGKVFETRSNLAVDDYQHWEYAVQRAREFGVTSLAAVPLQVGDRPGGVLAVRSTSGVRFGPEKMQLLNLLAAQVAPALEAARLVEERAAQARAFLALQELAVAAGGVLEPAALARLAVDRAQSLLHMDRSALYWWDTEEDRLLLLAASGPTGARTLRRGEDAAGIAFQRVEPVRVEDYQLWEHAGADARRRGYKSVLAVPLLVHDEPVGAVMASSRSTRYFDAEDVQLLSLLAAQVGPALVTARLHAHLVGSEQRFRTLYATLACGVLVQGPTGEVIDANRAAEQILGFSLEKMRGRATAELWGAATEDGLDVPYAGRPALVALKERRPVRNFTMRLRRLDGEVRSIQVDSIPVLNSRGEPVQVVSSFIDVSERRRAEAALRASERRFRAVFDRAAIGIARISLEGRLIDINPALCEMLGYSAEELLGTEARAVIHPDDFDPRMLQGLMQGEEGDTQLQIRCLRKDGGVIWGSLVASLVRGESGEPAFIIGMLDDITERRAQDAALAHQALHDSLTDLPNRNLLHDRVRQAIQMGQRGRQSMALLVMDLDRFKEVNDTFGHHVGDLLLREVAMRLKAELRGSDTVARLGGDEFAVVLQGIDSEAGSHHAAGKLLKSFEAPFHIEGEELEIGASIGIALYPQHGPDVDTLLRHADVAMYVAKRAGSGYAIYSADEDIHTPSRLALVAELRQGIERGELLLHYQPKIDLASQRITGAEALVRWQHPRLGLLLPDDFIPLAENTGLIRPLGIWVLDAALAQCRVWQDAGLSLKVAVNLSMRNLHDPHLLETLMEMLARKGVEPGRLQVEITESTLMADPEHAMRVLTSLDEMGVHLAIDDFGTGYSSLVYLRRLPVGEINIDKSFVVDMATEENAAVIVRSTIDLGHNLGLKVCAEGVEDRPTWDLLVAGGCDLGQGNLIDKPLAPEALVRRLNRPPPTALHVVS